MCTSMVTFKLKECKRGSSTARTVAFQPWHTYNNGSAVGRMTTAKDKPRQTPTVLNARFFVACCAHL